MTTLEKRPASASPARQGPEGRRPAPPVRPHVIGAVFARNFFGYLSNPAGYVFIALFCLVYSFVAFCLPAFFANNLANLDALNQYMPYLLLFFVPSITMSTWADERRQGTDELLLTLPARDVEVVLGKYLASLGIYSVALAFTFFPAAYLAVLGSPDLGLIASTYLGYWLMGAMLIAVGMVASMLTSNATVAFILGGLFCAVPIFAGLVGFLGDPASLLNFRGESASSGTIAGGPAQRLVESISVPYQFRDFGQGVVSFSGLLYFGSLTAAMLYVNMVLLGRRHWAGGERGAGRGLHAALRIACLVVALIGLDVLVARAGWRFDLTAEGLNTLSAESRRLIRDVPKDRPVYIQAYISPEVPREYVETKADLVNLLKEYAAIGGSRIRLNVVETTPASTAATDAAKRFGITAKRVQTLDQARMSSEEIYLGVAFSSGTEEVVVPFFDRGLPVEYELTRSIRVVSNSSRKKVGVLQTDAKVLGGFDFRSGSMGQDEQWEIVTELKKQYEVISVSADAPIPTNIDALIVAQPSSLTQKGIENLTAYVRSGKATLLLMDPLPMFNPELAPSQPRAPTLMFNGAQPPEPKGDLSPLLDLLGIDFPAGEIIWNNYNPHPQLEIQPEIVFIDSASGAEPAFANDPATAGLQEAVVLFGGLIRKRGGAGTDFVPLMKTNRSGGVVAFTELLQRSLFGLRPNPDRDYTPSDEAYVVAARLSGALPPPLPEPGKKEAGPSVKANVIVTADLDMISDLFFDLRRKSSESMDAFSFDNVTFVLNCVDELVGDRSFIALRSRRPKHRTLTLVERQSRTFIEQAARDRKKAEEQAKKALEKAQTSLDEKVERVRASKEKDEQTKRIELETLQVNENRKFEVTKAQIENEKRLAVLESRARKDRAVQTIQGRSKAVVLALPPLPPLLLGIAVFFVRAGRENRGTTPGRLA